MQTCNASIDDTEPIKQMSLEKRASLNALACSTPLSQATTAPCTPELCYLGTGLPGATPLGLSDSAEPDFGLDPEQETSHIGEPFVWSCQKRDDIAVSSAGLPTLMSESGQWASAAVAAEEWLQSRRQDLGIPVPAPYSGEFGNLMQSELGKWAQCIVAAEEWLVASRAAIVISSGMSSSTSELDKWPQTQVEVTRAALSPLTSELGKWAQNEVEVVRAALSPLTSELGKWAQNQVEDVRAALSPLTSDLGKWAQNEVEVVRAALSPLTSELGKWAQNQVEVEEWLATQRREQDFNVPAQALNQAPQRTRRTRRRGGVKRQRGATHHAGNVGSLAIALPELESELAQLADSQVRADEWLSQQKAMVFEIAVRGVGQTISLWSSKFAQTIRG